MMKNFFIACLLLVASFGDAGEMTLSLIKPDAVEAHHIGDIIAVLESNGFNVAALKMVQLTEGQAGEFYAEHKGKPFYPDTVQYMSSGPLVAIVLEGDNAIKKYRELMGPTDPKQAPANTLRAKFGTSKGRNALHGSDSPEAAKREINFFFASTDGTPVISLK